MTFITINLMPPLDGVVCKVGYFFNGTWIEYPLNFPPSEGGVLDFQFAAGGAPGVIFQVRIPEQTIDGVTYVETFSESGWYMDTPNFSETITLTTDEPPPNGNGGNGNGPPPNGNGEPEPVNYQSIVQAAIPTLVGAGLIYFLK